MSETTRETPPDAPALPVVLLHPEAKLPARSRPGDAGLDLRSVEPLTVHPRSVATIRTGLALAVPVGCVGLILGRSGLAREGIDVLGGCIDSGYAGEVGVVLHNTTSAPFVVGVAQRVAQLVVLPILLPTPVLADSLPGSDRGAAGFGSSGNF